MRLRHKIPTIFNIYMLDVICCALGCVVLLWQVAYQEAEMQTDDAQKQHAAAVLAKLQYEKAQHDLLSASSDVTHLQGALADWKQKHASLAQTLSAAEKDRDAAAALAAERFKTLTAANANLALSKQQYLKLQGDLEKLLAFERKTKAELTGVVKLNADLLVRIALAEKNSAALKTEIALADTKAKDQAGLLKLSEDNARKLQKLLDAMRDDNKDTQAKVKLTELQLKMREQDLDKARKDLLALRAASDKTAKDLASGTTNLADAKRLIAALTLERDQYKDKIAAGAKELSVARLDKDKLTRRVADLQAEADQRFAGIPLTGENVVFLIDMSGSMMMKDDNKDDPDKWPFLCETLMKLMRSIPTLQRFQVILFSDKTTYLFGNRDLWLKYDGADTAKATRNALLKIKAEGNTNMHDAFEEAFRYRKLKLDTIYIFSDGLPNVGIGAPENTADLPEAQRSHHLGKFVRYKLKNEWNRTQEGQRDVRINAVGFFFDSPDVGAFLWALAREHKGSFVGLR